MKLVAYLRVSSVGQIDGYGLDIQKTSIQAWAKRNGHRIVAWTQDAVSGTLDAPDRPGLLEALKMLRQPPVVEGIVVLDYKRLARQLTIQEAILALVWREGGKVFTVEDGEIKAEDPDDPMRDLIRQMMGAFAEFDRKTIVKRMRDGRKIKAEQGRKATGQYKFGTQGVGAGRDRDEGPNPDEQIAIDRILHLRTNGSSYRTIARLLDMEGLKPRRAQQWSAMAVRNVVLRAAGKGSSNGAQLESSPQASPPEDPAPPHSSLG